MLKYKIVFQIGDIIQSKIMSYYFNSNLSYDEIRDAHTKGEKLLGFYTDLEIGRFNRNIPEHIFNKLKSAGFDFGNFEPPYSIEAMDFLEIFLFVVKFANQNFQYEKIEMNEMYIGGKAFIRN